MAVDWSLLTGPMWVVAGLWLAAAVLPIVHAWQRKTPLTLGITISLILTWLIQALATWYFGQNLMFVLGALVPALGFDPLELHRYVSAAWMHAGLMHLLGNAIVILLVGIPLELRLGRGRFLAIYIIGALGGNIGWTLANLGSWTPSIGASGAAFGLLGCYMACWPKDEIEFPIILIRKWPISLIVFIKLGLEIMQYGLLSTEHALADNVAHLAHITGFFAAYLAGRPIARNGPVPPGVEDGGPTMAGMIGGESRLLRGRLAALDTDPWAAAGKALEGPALRTLERLRDEGDELETREAWLEALVEVAQCPVCDAPLQIALEQRIPTLKCAEKPRHFSWPQAD